MTNIGHEADGDTADAGSPLRGRLGLARAKRQQMTEAARAFRRAPTESERLLWRALRDVERTSGVRFRRQHPVGPFIVDFYCPAGRLVIEVDGAIHATQHDRDQERQSLLESRGYRILRVTAEEVIQDPHQLIHHILATLAEPI